LGKPTGEQLPSCAQLPGPCTTLRRSAATRVMPTRRSAFWASTWEQHSDASAAAHKGLRCMRTSAEKAGRSSPRIHGTGTPGSGAHSMDQLGENPRVASEEPDGSKRTPTRRGIAGALLRALCCPNLPPFLCAILLA